MGLLDRASGTGIAGTGGRFTVPSGVLDRCGAKAMLKDFSARHPLFHCVILRAGGRKGLSAEVAEMTAPHGAACAELPGGRCMVLLPGALDMELFSHRISQSAGADVVFQSAFDSGPQAFDALKFHLP